MSNPGFIQTLLLHSEVGERVLKTIVEINGVRLRNSAGFGGLGCSYTNNRKKIPLL